MTMPAYENKCKCGYTIWKLTIKNLYGQFICVKYYDSRHSSSVEIARCKSEGYLVYRESIFVHSDYFDGLKVHDSVTPYEANPNSPPF